MIIGDWALAATLFFGGFSLGFLVAGLALVVVVRDTCRRPPISEFYGELGAEDREP